MRPATGVSYENKVLIMNRRSRFSIDTFYNVIGNGIPLLVGILSLPLLLRYLGESTFGFLTLVWALIGASGMLDLGVGRAMTYELAKHDDSEQLQEKEKFSAGIVIALLSGIILTIGVLLLQCFSKIISGLMQIDPAVFETAVFWLAISILPSALLSVFRGALEGKRCFFQANILRLVQGCLLFLVPLFCGILGVSSLSAIIAAIGVSRLCLAFVYIWLLRTYFSHRKKPTISDVAHILRFGSWVTLSGIVSPIMVYGDRFFIASTVGVAKLALYVIPQEVLQRLLIIPMSLSGAVLPRVAGISESKTIREEYSRNLFMVGIIMLPICAVAWVSAPLLLSVWISEQFSEAASGVLRLLCIGLWFNSLAQIPLTFLHARGRPKLVAAIHVIELPFYLLAIYFAAREHELIGVSAVWAVRVTLDFFLLHWAFTRTKL